MTSRRQLLGLFPGLALLAALPARAQRPVRLIRVGTLLETYQDNPASAPFWTSFRKRLVELGHVEGKTYVIESRGARGETSRLPALATELVAQKPDLIVAPGTPAALAAKQASSVVPIVAIGPAEPVRTGLVASLAKPGANVTGISVDTSAIAGKVIEVLREVAPAMKSIAYLTNPENPAARLTLQEYQAVARPLGATVRILDGRSRGSVEEAFGTMTRERIQGLIVGVASDVFEQAQQIVDAAAKQRIPAIYLRKDYAALGGLLTYGADRDRLAVRSADYVHRILQGTKPAELPFELISVFNMTVNLKTAKAAGVKIPQSVLARADEVIR